MAEEHGSRYTAVTALSIEIYPYLTFNSAVFSKIEPLFEPISIYHAFWRLLT